MPASTPTHWRSSTPTATTETNYVLDAAWTFDTPPVALAPGRSYRAALSHRGGTQSIDLRVFDANGANIASCTHAIDAMPDLTGGYVTAGVNFEGTLANFRFWADDRSDEALVAGWETVAPAAQSSFHPCP